ncbi:MAG: hypothetical protein WA399_21005 [Acidobacteriaceae bacterium]
MAVFVSCPVSGPSRRFHPGNDGEEEILISLSLVVVVVQGGKVETRGPTAQGAAAQEVLVLENPSAEIANVGNPRNSTVFRYQFSTL